jgi:linoleoyl-CoA desaturase
MTCIRYCRYMVSGSPKIRFAAGGSFQADLVQRVDEYFEISARPRHGGWPIAVKIAAMLSWLVLSWALLMFSHPGPWLQALLSVSVGLAVAGVGFCVMHDANHGAASSSPRVNRVLSFSLDLLGASSALWRHKHNVLHHTYTNVSGADPDLEGGGAVLRLAPWQPRYPWHRFQRFYVWLVYALFPLKWWFIDDVRELAEGRVRGRELFTAILGKILFVGWAFALPAALHLSWGLVGLWAIALVTLGNVMAFVFQLAHCVGEAEFVERSEVDSGWMRHQLATTVDFAPTNFLLTWYLGGLNFQVEHHLFSRVCHVHYPALRRIVAETCRAHRVPYRCQPTLWSALEANWRWLRKLGEPATA